MNVIEIVKAHPVPIGIGVVVLILLISSRSSQPSSASVSNAGAFAAQAQITGMNAQTSIALGQQSVERAKINAASAGARTTSATNLFGAIAGMLTQNASNDSNNSIKVMSNAFAHADNQQAFANQLQLGESNINAGIRINADKINGSIRAIQEDNNFKLSEIGAKTQGSLALMRGDTINAMDIFAQQSPFIASTLASQMQHEENMLFRQTEAAVTKAQSDAHAQNVKNDQQWAKDANEGVHSWFKLGSYF